MELLYLLYLNGVVKVLLSQQSPTLVSCDISRHCTAHFLSSCVVVEGETMNYIEFFCAQAQKGTRTDLPRKCQLLSFSKRRLLKGKKHPPKHEIGHSIRGRNIEEEPAPNSPSFILLIPILHVMNNQHCTTRFPCCFVLMPACLAFLFSVSHWCAHVFLVVLTFSPFRFFW